MNGDRAIETLREALRLSPDNIPLRRHLAESLLGQGRPDLAEAEFREALALAPDDTSLKVGLAGAFIQQGKNSLAAVILEDVARRPDAPPRAFVLYARLLFAAGEVEESVRQYRRGVEADPAVADAEFAERLGIRVGDEGSEEDPPPFETPDDVVEGRVRSSWDDPAPGLGAEVERPKLKFADVGGMDGLRRTRIRMKIIHPIRHPELYRAYGKAIGGGILLYGPPGCGKTYLARATAGEISAGFLAVGINDVLEMWIGSSERNLHALFGSRPRQNPPQACSSSTRSTPWPKASRADLKGERRAAVDQPVPLGAGRDQRAGMRGCSSWPRPTRPWHLDPAFRRPGQFLDRHPVRAVAAARRAGAGGDPPAALPGEAGAGRRLRPPRQEDREPLGGRPEVGRRPGGRGLKLPARP